ncbi:MAG: pyrroline-5-carboxylate reductase [Candidatus Omnitrophica bacterium]|nr:pyrroline-5-carboxylate reductase [Candidatus Omnitrophota bacterium]
MSPAPRPLPLAPLRGQRIGVIGAGNMGQALLGGLRRAGVPAAALMAAERDQRRCAQVRRLGVRCVSLDVLVERASIILVAVKPQDIREVLQRIGALRQGRGVLVISIAAGIPIRAIQRLVGKHPVVRVMPNLPATVGSGISALACARGVSAAEHAAASAIFQGVGEVVEVPERLLDAVTAISGSGPAYFFTVFQALREAGASLGLPGDVAERLAVHTALGSAKLALAAPGQLPALIARVASKKGTTEAALKMFRHRRLSSVIEDGVKAAARRSRELTAMLDTQVGA